MNDKLNKTTICAIAAIEIVDFSKKSDAEQINSKYSLNQLVNLALKEYARLDRILLDKGDGVVMAYLSSPEDLLAIILDIRQQILQHNAQGLVPIFVRMGIHLGAVRVVRDVNEQPNFMGEGLNEAQRIMHFAEENGIVVSPAYYAVTLPLPNEIAALYAYSGFKKDAQATEYQAYTLGTMSEIESGLAQEVQSDTVTEEVPIEQPSQLPAYQPAKNTSLLKVLNWKLISAGLAILIGLVGLVAMLRAPKTPEIIMSSSEVVTEEVKPEIVKPTAPIVTQVTPAQSATAPVNALDSHGLLPNETIEELPASNAEVSKTADSKTEQVTVEAVKKTVTDEAGKVETKRAHKKNVKKSTAEEVLSVEKEAEPPSQTTAETAANSSTEKTVAPAKAEPQTNSHAKSTEKTNEKSAWDSFKDSVKQGSQQEKCTQGEIALGQCR